ncbi:hypothetical protein [Rugosimonospora africana]|uniref:hypothetical protein n=1 Tax=Rugosimonospora africana TaxID=556532 RepID=UPI00194576E3|nr:hypothetical protein [Rugosimonospora africana]
MAKAPASEEELAGERAAVAGFAAAYRGAVPTGVPKRRRRAWIPLSAKGLAVKAAAGVAVLLASGTAVAAETGNLPAGAQEHAHSMFSTLGVPAPDAGGRPTGAGPAGVAGSVRPSTPAIPTPGASGTTPGPKDPAMLALCRAWDAERKDPHGKAMAAEDRRALSAAAGGQSRVPAFCAALLGEPPDNAATTHPVPATATPSHSDNGKGNGGTGGNPDGNNGARPTPSPHR